MNEIIVTIWITTTIFTIIPNAFLAYKFYTKEVEDIMEAGFLHFAALWVACVVSVLMLANIVHVLLYS